MNLQEFRAKYPKTKIADFIYGIGIEADHEESETHAEFLKDVYELLRELFPDCDPFKD